MEKLKATIVNLSHKGLGVVSHPDGRIFFARGVWPGDTAEFQIDDNAKSYEAIKTIRVLEHGIKKDEIPCPHQGSCGGCPWMGIPYEEQIKAKSKRIDFIISKNNLFVKKNNPIIPAPEMMGYRNRAQFKTDGESLGYVSEGTNDLVKINECKILNPPMQKILSGILSQIPKTDWEPSEGFNWNYLDVDDEMKLDEVVINKRRTFRQGNETQNLKMKEWIKDTLKNYSKDTKIMELYCGSGNFTETLSELGFKNIVAAELRGEAVEKLKNKKLKGVQTLELDMSKKGVWFQLAKQQPETKVLIVDPPREGIEIRKGLFQHMEQLSTILYISCEPNTWARDIKDFQKEGWMIESLTPIDLFPQTPHIELMSVLKKKG